MNQAIVEYLKTRQEIIVQLQQLLVEVSLLDHEPEKLDPDSPLFGSGFGLDSIDAIEILVGVEQQFGLQLDEDNLSGPLYLRTINTITDLIMAQKQKAQV